MNETFDALIAEAIAIRYVIVSLGGMATKSIVEDVLMERHSDLTRYDAHELMNYIEYHDLDRFPLRRRFEGPAPTIDDYPEIRNHRPKFIRFPDETERTDR